MNEKQRSGLFLALLGVALTAVALRPPRALVRLYLAVEQAVAVFLGVLLAAAGLAGLLGKGPARQAAKPDYTIEYGDDDQDL